MSGEGVGGSLGVGLPMDCVVGQGRFVMQPGQLDVGTSTQVLSLFGRAVWRLARSAVQHAIAACPTAVWLAPAPSSSSRCSLPQRCPSLCRLIGGGAFGEVRGVTGAQQAPHMMLFVLVDYVQMVLHSSASALHMRS